MQLCRTINEFRSAHAALAGRLGAVPTMGFLHTGHLSLIARAQADNDHSAVSIFVNPTQFNNPADLATYPTDLERDLALLAMQGVDMVFLPSPEVMYPKGYQTYITVEGVSQGLEGEHRPGHFRGVATVVCKLFNIMQPQRAYFGQKDAQQVRVIQQMAHDLDMPVEVVVCPTLRDPDGLAMSSRNVKLSAEERAAAPVLYQALQQTQTLYESGQRDPQALKMAAQAIIQSQPLAHLEYISIADYHTLQEATQPTEGRLLISLAAYFGSTRLIDNILVG
jgi:pantoate--beta-alanine ligase